MQIRIRSKRMVLALTLIAAALIIVTGAFAWNSLLQARINTFRTTVVAGVNLHDDFNAPNKDVYVENSGEIPVIVRIRLTEYLETAERGSLVAGHERTGGNETDNARLNWTPHSGTPGVSECEADEYCTLGKNWPSGDWFHEYYEWKMGGQKFFKSVKNQLIRVDGDAHTDADGNETEFDDRYYYTDKDGNLVDIDNYICSDPFEYDGTEENVRQTLDAYVITMADWLSSDRKPGEFWVIDTDGWCYWAQMLYPDTATGLLLDSVTRTDKAFDSSAEYCINVWLQAVDEIDIELFRLRGNGGITDSAMLFVEILADKILVATDGLVYENNRDGTFTQLTDSQGDTLENPRPFIPLGDYSDVYAKIDSDPANRLYIGDRFDLTRLIWDGEIFTNYDELNDLGAPWYNITLNETGEYAAVGSEIGADGNVYLRIVDGGGGGMLYLGSVKYAEGVYSQNAPGTGPYGIIYPGEDGIGTASSKQTEKPASTWWENATDGPGFNYTDIWQWDDVNNLPVLQGVPLQVIE